MWYSAAGVVYRIQRIQHITHPVSVCIVTTVFTIDLSAGNVKQLRRGHWKIIVSDGNLGFSIYPGQVL